MGRERKRKRSLSHTPPVEWETLLVPPVSGVAPVSDVVAEVPIVAAPAPALSSDREQARSSRQAAKEEADLGEGRGPSEREAWRVLAKRLAALQNDPQTEQLLADKHPELLHVAEDVGASGQSSRSIEQSREAAKGWFERGLRGSNRHGPAQRADLCIRLADILKARAAAILSELQAGTAIEAATRALRRGKADEEGPLLCAIMAKELEGSRYEGIWISRVGPGRYILGDEDPASGLPDKDSDGANIDRVIRVAVRAAEGKLIIDGFFHKGEDDMNPVKCQVGPFLTVYFESLSLKEACSKWNDFLERRAKVLRAGLGFQPGIVVRAATTSAAQSNQDQQKESLKALAASLPPGWELRESRSKKGQYYYANPAKGLSQHERPKV